MKTLLLILLLTTVSAVSANNKILISTKPSEAISCNPTLVSLTVGPTETIKQPKNDGRLGRHFRIASYLSEIYLSVMIDEITVGEENSMVLHNTRELKGDFPGLMTEIKWTSPTALQFVVTNKRYRLSNIDNSLIVLEEISNN